MTVHLGVAFGSVWAGAQGLTNTPAAETTNGWPRGEDKLDLHPLTFGLERDGCESPFRRRAGIKFKDQGAV
jgi:hypothetical protein